MNSLLKAASILFALVLAVNPSEPAANHSTQESLMNSIVMEDAILMMTSTDETNGDITGIVVAESTGPVVFFSSGCNASKCYTDLSSLPKGYYNVQVNTSSGHSFSGMVMAGI